MQMEARTLGQPGANQLRFVGAVVVQNQGNVQLRGHVLLDDVEEFAKLGRAMTAVCLADDRSGLCIQRGAEAGGAVSLVVVRAAFDLARSHGQQRRRAVQRLNLILLVAAQHQSAVRRVEIQPDDVAHLVDKQRIARELEGLAAMRGQGKSAPDAMNATAAESAALGQRTRGAPHLASEMWDRASAQPRTPASTASPRKGPHSRVPKNSRAEGGVQRAARND